MATLELITAEVAADEGGTKWEGTCVLANVSDLLQFQVNKPFNLLFFGESYSLIVDSLALNRQGANKLGGASVEVTVYGVSPIVNYQSPRATLVSKTWVADESASQIALEMIPGLSWEIVDWTVPAHTFGAEKAAPADIVIKLAEAAGGLLESLPNGSIRVRYKHLVSVPQYGPATKSIVLVDEVDNFSYVERYTPNRLVNLIKITDEQDKSQADRLEFVPDENNADKGVLRVYPATWRDTVSMHSTAPLASQTYKGVVPRQVTETIEFVDGKANTQYPIVAIDSYAWNTVDLGTPSFEFYNTQVLSSVALNAYSLLSITYQTQAHEFDVLGFDKTTVQMVVEDA